MVLIKAQHNYKLACVQCCHSVGFLPRTRNRTLELDSPFQTFAVGLLVKFID